MEPVEDKLNGIKTTLDYVHEVTGYILYFIQKGEILEELQFEGREDLTPFIEDLKRDVEQLESMIDKTGLSMRYIFHALKKKCSRLYEIGYDLFDTREPEEVSYHERNKLISLFKEIDKDIEYLGNNYKSPEIIELSPCDCELKRFHIVSCWYGATESYLPLTREELLAFDKEAYLNSIGGTQQEANYMKSFLIKEGFLAEADFL
ncbi:hypothetical protein [Escherichia albertii]|uniref:hypothetical protein n=1 Tax=Escherichia albertii TaxID=208962 RepID=UPI000743338F|nr:hypothetical protein [Escherichia albertii]